ncbi:hypothetical protein HKCCE2091_12705 [Rhodobacterales bacterium HKCCE2091]|nr:hypothetical protein [Rhodobacterales bacterium HKCCE2091]
MGVSGHAALIAAFVLPSAVLAQSAELTTGTTDHYFYASTSFGAITLTCSESIPGTTPPPGFVQPPFPYAVNLWLPELGAPDVVIDLDGTAYQLPPLSSPTGDGAVLEVAIGMGDPLILDMLDGGAVRVIVEGQEIAAYPDDGWNAILRDGLAFCDATARGYGVPVPDYAVEVSALLNGPVSTPAVPAAQDLGYAPARNASLPAGYTLAPLLPLDAEPPAAAAAHVADMCGGGFETDPAGVQVLDIDGDGQRDYVLNYSYVDCQGTLTGRAFCGAANCSLQVFLSSRGHAAPEEFLGVALDAVTDAQGRVGLLLSGTASVCGDGACDSPYYWTGTDLARQTP